ncbi:MAG: hypothetical protein M0Q93_02160 [Terrimicrobiaceae bacterium]|nr:hypothetical protein [Terrimicrobiaceae bacterium]
MAIHFQTSTPSKLLNSFKEAIDKKIVATWSYDKDGDFTHATEQWKNSAWLRPVIANNELIFSIIKPQNSNISTEIYAIYHGRFIESMLVHCDSLFTKVSATAFPADNDLVS